MNRFFADISNNNTQTVNWDAYAKQGQHVLVGLKATEGTNFLDRTHVDRCERAHKAGVWVLHYHFGHANEDAKAQAQFFWSQLHGHFAAKDFACLDIEVTDGLGMAQVGSWVKRFDAEFRRLSGHSLVLYASESFLKDLYIAGGSVAGNRCWSAAYGGSGNVPRGCSRWAHQFTDGSIGPEPHSCAGIGNCDVSELNLATYLRLRLKRP